MNTLKRIAYFIRWGHWPKRMRYPNGVPRTISPEARKTHQLALMVESGEISYEEMHRRLGVPYPVMENEPLTESDWLGNGREHG